MFKVRFILFGFLAFISLCSYAQRDSTLKHKSFVGVGTEPIILLGNTTDSRGRRRIIVDAQIGYKQAFKYFNFRANIETLYLSRVREGRPMRTSMIFYPSFGLERRLNPRSKVQVLYGIDLMVDITMGITFPELRFEQVGIGPVLGVEYKLARNVYMCHEFSIVYGPWLQRMIWTGEQFWWWGFNTHKIFDITVYYGF